MGIVRDVTIDQLTQAVQGISSTGISDSTGQAINNTLGTLGKDTSLQGIISALQNLQINVNQTASNVSYNNTTSGLTASNVQGAIDEVNEARYQIKNYNTSIPVDNMHGNDYSGVYWMTKPNWSGMPSGSYGYLEVVGNLQKFYPYALSGRADIYVRMYINNTWNEWKRVSSLSDASIIRASGVSSSVQLPGITRRGNVVIIHFTTMLPAGTYYNLYKALPTPTEQQHCIVSFNGYNSITILMDGTIRFNNSVTTNSSQYIIGQLVYLTDD